MMTEKLVALPEYYHVPFGSLIRLPSGRLGVVFARGCDFYSGLIFYRWVPCDAAQETFQKEILEKKYITPDYTVFQKDVEVVAQGAIRW